MALTTEETVTMATSVSRCQLGIN